MEIVKNLRDVVAPSSWLTNTRSLNLSVHGSNLENSRHAGAVAARCSTGGNSLLPFGLIFAGHQKSINCHCEWQA